MRITFFVRDPRSKVAKASAELPLIIRLRNGQTDIWQNTRLSVNPAWWDKQRQQVRARLMLSPKLRQSVDNEVAAIRQYVTDADVKPTLLKNVRPASLLKITWESKGLTESIGTDVHRVFYHVEVETELGEKEMLRIWAISRQDAEDAARDIVERCDLGLKGTECKALKVIELQ